MRLYKRFTANVASMPAIPLSLPLLTQCPPLPTISADEERRWKQYLKYVAVTEQSTPMTQTSLSSSNSFAAYIPGMAQFVCPVCNVELPPTVSVSDYFAHVEHPSPTSAMFNQGSYPTCRNGCENAFINKQSRTRHEQSLTCIMEPTSGIPSKDVRCYTDDHTKENCSGFNANSWRAYWTEHHSTQHYHTEGFFRCHECYRGFPNKDWLKEHWRECKARVLWQKTSIRVTATRCDGNVHRMELPENQYLLRSGTDTNAHDWFDIMPSFSLLQQQIRTTSGQHFIFIFRNSGTKPHTALDRDSFRIDISDTIEFMSALPDFNIREDDTLSFVSGTNIKSRIMPSFFDNPDIEAHMAHGYLAN